jgi:hypothetical protein
MHDGNSSLLDIEGRLYRALDCLPGVRAGDRHSLVLLLAFSHGSWGIDMHLLLHCRNWRGSSRRGEALGRARRGGVSLGRRGLQLEVGVGKRGCRDNEILAAGSEGVDAALGAVIVVVNLGEVLVSRWRKARRESVLREGGRLGEARSVGGGLRAQLGKVEVGTSLVTHVHGFVQLALCPVAVEDNAVQGDADDLDDELDDDADQRPVLQAAHQIVVDVLGLALDRRAPVLYAGPAPEVFVVAVVARELQNTSCHSPHHHAKDEPTDSEQRIVDADLLSSPVPTAAVHNKDGDADAERDAGAD